ncbi:phosphodiester glycosidase family protein [Roseateles terrae]|uniref:Phosphodiester glycosidase domain-containing protein n=1 Tax=Roseateles terrae TaxID=431060 RepID=A0ABR6GRT1_9BURK|nr:phosphodiester glycosidase family protein [Roseateles terrae]MBB3194823.1 hypothetical protein [Roseateles terrae]
MAPCRSKPSLSNSLPGEVGPGVPRSRPLTRMLGLLALAAGLLSGCASPVGEPSPTDARTGAYGSSGPSGPTAAPSASSVPAAPPAAAVVLSWSPVDGATGLLYARDAATKGQVLHWLRLDLQDPTLALRLTPPRDRGRPLDQFEGATQALAAVNASFFTSRFEPRGWTLSAGEAWTSILAADDSPWLHCDTRQHCDMQLTPPVPAPPPGGLAVAGTPWLIRDGSPRQASDDNSCNFCKVRHPRTAIGLDASRRFLTVVVVEGRQPGAVGMTLAELAQHLRSQGVAQALNLDGGGSTALLLQGRLVTGRPFNEPGLRPLANALMVSRAAGAAAPRHGKDGSASGADLSSRTERPPSSASASTSASEPSARGSVPPRPLLLNLQMSASTPPQP